MTHKRSLRILEWVAYSFSSRSSQPRNQIGVSCIAGGFFTNSAIRHASLWISDFCFLRYMPRNVIAESHDSSILNFLRNLTTVFHSCCTNLPAHQQCPRIPFSTHPHQYLLLVVFMITSILTDIRWYFIVILICISMLTSNVEHLFMCPLAIHMSFWKNICSGVLPIFKNQIVFLILSCMSVYILDINPCWLYQLHIFFAIQQIVFLFLMVSFAVQKRLTLIMSHKFNLSFGSFALGDRSKKLLQLLSEQLVEEPKMFQISFWHAYGWNWAQGIPWDSTGSLVSSLMSARVSGYRALGVLGPMPVQFCVGPGPGLCGGQVHVWGCCGLRRPWRQPACWWLGLCFCLASCLAWGILVMVPIGWWVGLGHGVNKLERGF